MYTFPKLNLNSKWVEDTLASLSLAQKIGQLLHPCLQPSVSVEAREAHLDGIQPGGIFLFPGLKRQFAEITTWFQEMSTVPVIVSADLENGAGRIIEDATTFPELMSLAATGREDLAYEMGRAAAIEGRACGIHWSYGPIVDMNLNPYCPGASTRTLGSDPDLIAKLSGAMIRGMQENGLCATVKHFPGAGLDDRDSHICTTINSLRMHEWLALSGRMFQNAIDMGVWSIMTGHISLPAWDPGSGEHIQAAPPSTISKKLLTDLLRDRMGFDGVIITDALDMGGVTSWGSFDEIIPSAILAGCDMILFSEPRRDFDILMGAVKEGRLTEERINQSVRRILALKERLGLHVSTTPFYVSETDKISFQQVSEEISEKALTIVRDKHKTLPLTLSQDRRVLCYHLRGDPEENVDTFDDLLREMGVDVDTYTEQDIGKFPRNIDLSNYDFILLNVVLTPSWGTSRIRPAGNYMRDVWSLITSHHPGLVVISYGSPYIGYEMPHVTTVINSYSPDTNTQMAVLKLLTGQIQANGTSPVDLDSPYQLKALEGLRCIL